MNNFILEVISFEIFILHKKKHLLMILFSTITENTLTHSYLSISLNNRLLTLGRDPFARLEWNRGVPNNPLKFLSITFQ